MRGRASMALVLLAAVLLAANLATAAERRPGKLTPREEAARRNELLALQARRDAVADRLERLIRQELEASRGLAAARRRKASLRSWRDAFRARSAEREKLEAEQKLADLERERAIRAYRVDTGQAGPDDPDFAPRPLPSLPPPLPDDPAARSRALAESSRRARAVIAEVQRVLKNHPGGAR